MPQSNSEQATQAEDHQTTKAVALLASQLCFALHRLTLWRSLTGESKLFGLWCDVVRVFHCRSEEAECFAFKAGDEINYEEFEEQAHALKDDFWGDVDTDRVSCHTLVLFGCAHCSGGWALSILLAADVVDCRSTQQFEA